MNNKYLDIINQIKDKCQNDQFELILIASILELSNFLEKDEFYNQELIALKEEPYEKKFPILYKLLTDLSKEISDLEKIEEDVIISDTLKTFFDTYLSDFEE